MYVWITYNGNQVLNIHSDEMNAHRGCYSPCKVEGPFLVQDMWKTIDVITSNLAIYERQVTELQSLGTVLVEENRRLKAEAKEWREAFNVIALAKEELESELDHRPDC
jgi:hypothetical protein